MWYDRIHYGLLIEKSLESPLMSRALISKWLSILGIAGIYVSSFKGRIYFYKVCPFGVVVSAHFWSRLGGAFQRLFHRMCFLPHASFLYVDDLLMFQETSIIGLSASVIAILCILLRLPISWKKCELGPTIVWIGWEFYLAAGFIVLPTPKRSKLLELINKLLMSSHCSKKSLERFLGWHFG